MAALDNMSLSGGGTELFGAIARGLGQGAGELLPICHLQNKS